MTPEVVLEFWYEEIDPALWFRKDADFDTMIHQRFAALHASAAAGELSEWRRWPRGRLAEVIVLDQFSRNLYRDSPLAFAQDGMALVLAQEAVAQGQDRELAPHERMFLYMPYMHSESARVHEQAERLFHELENPRVYDFELKHKAIIDRFGRYPHRNALLGRVSTAEEEAFLQEPGSSF